MKKHKLFIEAEGSPEFKSSSDESRRSQKKQQEAMSTMTSKTGLVIASTPVRKNLHQRQMHTSVTEEGAAVRRTPRVNRKCVATQADFTTFKQDSDSGSDSMDVDGFFSSSNQKLPYSFAEDEEILKYILRGQHIFRVSSILLWKQLEHKKQNPKRTYQSLKNRFLRNIKPNLFTTYRHLIPDEDTLEKILLKFPELKKQVGKKETLSRIKLPERINTSKVLERSTSSKIMQEDHTSLKRPEATQTCLPDSLNQSTPRPSTSQLSNKLLFHRKVELSGESLTVHVNLNFEEPPPKLSRIYERYWNLKSKNKLTPCSACGRCGGPEECVDSGAESDAFISNSLESKKSEMSSPKKKLILRKNKSYPSQKRKKKNLIPESCTSQRSCSPSLLNDVNEVDELDEDAAKDVESNSKTTRPAKPSNSAVLIKETDAVPGEPSPVVSKDTDFIYQNTVEEFRKLIDSDEEEVLVKKCLRKNRKIIGFDANLSVEEINVDSYFIKSDSPGLESVTAGESTTRCTNSAYKSPINSGRSLAQNMMNMLGKTN